MSRRSYPVTVLFLLVMVGSAQAHRLDAEYKILTDKRVRVECWFERGGPPKAAAVRVERGNGSVLIEGKADNKGEFVFTYEEPQPLKVIVDAGDGHRVELSIPAEKFANEGDVGSADPQPETDQNRSHRHDQPFPWGTVLLGVAGLLLPGAFVLGVLKWRRRQIAKTNT